MKTNIITIGCLLLSSAMITGCNDYLKEDSGDLLIPGKVDEFASMLYTEGYPSTFNDDVNFFALMTDDVEMSPLETDMDDQKSLEEKKWDQFDFFSNSDGLEAYSWKQKIQLADNFWSTRYKNILACNAVIDALPSMNDEGDRGKYNYLAAQAYAMRAYHYWTLVNTYALPWSEANLDKPGVVLRTAPQIDTAPKARATVGQVYEQINKDMKKAEEYIAEATYPGNKHLLTPAAIYMLGTRIALSQENWSEVIRYGELFAGNGGYYVYDLKGVSDDQFGTDQADNAFQIMNGKINNEILFTFGTTYRYLDTYPYLALHSSQNYGLGFRPSRSGGNSLIESYAEGDLRRKAWFAQDKPAQPAENWWDDPKPKECCYDYPVKYRRTVSDAVTPSEKNYHENWRSVEALLNVAEAMARKTNSISTDAINLLNTLRRNRFDSSSFTELTSADFASGDELVKFIWAERRRELCFEEAMRFWDLKRQGMPSIEHRWYTYQDATETDATGSYDYIKYVLPEGSNNYLLSIPREELNYNDGCTDNVRDIISAQ